MSLCLCLICRTVMHVFNNTTADVQIYTKHLFYSYSRQLRQDCDFLKADSHCALKGSPSQCPYTLRYMFNISNSTARGFQTAWLHKPQHVGRIPNYYGNIRHRYVTKLKWRLAKKQTVASCSSRDWKAATYPTKVASWSHIAGLHSLCARYL